MNLRLMDVCNVFLGEGKKMRNPFQQVKQMESGHTGMPWGLEKKMYEPEWRETRCSRHGLLVILCSFVSGRRIQVVEMREVNLCQFNRVTLLLTLRGSDFNDAISTLKATKEKVLYGVMSCDDTAQNVGFRSVTGSLSRRRM